MGVTSPDKHIDSWPSLPVHARGTYFNTPLEKKNLNNTHHG